MDTRDEKPRSDKVNVRGAVTITFLQNFLQIALTMFSVMVLARLLTPAQIGLFSVAMGFFVLTQVFRDFGVANYLVQEKDLTKERIRTAFGLSITFGWSMALIVFVSSGPLSRFYGDPALADVLRTLSFNFVVLPVSIPALTLLRREMAFGTLFRINMVGSVVLCATQITLAACGFGAMSLAWASLAHVTTLSLLGAYYRSAAVWLVPSLSEWRRILSFGGLASLTSLFSYLGFNSIDLIVGRVIGFAGVGIYSRAQGLIFLFHRDIMGAVHQVAFPAFAAEHRKGANLRAGYTAALQHVTGIGWPFYAVAAITAEPLITTMFGEQWAPSVPLVRILALVFAIGTLISLSGHVLLAMGQVKRLCVAEGIVLCARIVGVLVGAHFGLAAVAAAQIPVVVLGLIIQSRYMFLMIGLSPLDVVKSCRASLVVMFASSIVPFLVMESDLRQELPPIALLAVAIVGAAVGWLGAVYLTRHPARREVGLLLKRITDAITRRRQGLKPVGLL
jgi:O-antigen/teichoic acid export membrane protein